MTNKTLRRIITKTFNVKAREELVASLADIHAKIENSGSQAVFSDFQNNLSDCLDMLDKAFTDLDRVIDIRDRSLAISSKELVGLNDTISAQAGKQAAVLNQLHSILDLLRDGQEEELNSDENDLNKMVANVDRLVKNQVNAARDMKTLFDEGLRISSVLN